MEVAGVIHRHTEAIAMSQSSQEIVAALRAGRADPSWRVLRGQTPRFLLYAILVAAAVLYQIWNIGGDWSFIIALFPVPRTWKPWLGYGADVLIAVVVAGALVYLISRFRQSRSRAVVLHPSGVIEANLRSGKALREFEYADLARLRLGEGEEAGADVFKRVKLTWKRADGKKQAWTIEEYFNLSPTAIAQLILMEHARASEAGAPPESEEGRRFKLLSAAEKLVHARRHDAPGEARALTTKWYVRVCARILLPVVVALTVALCAVGVAALILPIIHPTFLNFMRGPSRLAQNVVWYFALVVYALFVVACLRLLPVGLRLMRHLYSQTLIVTPDGCLVGDLRTGAVLREIPFADLTHLRLELLFIAYVLRYTRKDGTKETLTISAMDYFYTIKADTFVQEFVTHFARAVPGATV